MSAPPPLSDARGAWWARVGIVLLVAAAAAVISTVYAREGADGDSVSLSASGIACVVLLAGSWWVTRWSWMPLVMLLPAAWVAVSGPIAVSGEDDSLVLPFVLQAVGLLAVLGCCRYGLQERTKVRQPTPAPYQPPIWPPGRGPGPGPSQAMLLPPRGNGAPMTRPTGAPNPGDQARFRPMDPLGAHLLMENQQKRPAGPSSWPARRATSARAAGIPPRPAPSHPLSAALVPGIAGLSQTSRVFWLLSSEQTTSGRS